ncbi:MAG: hypothetical protein EXR74_10160 [Bdellovibrionales bacterium]|nr:hypothetical protein [Bdellovibrionales bacterium]
MKPKNNILAGAFSFCLPGLGQLFLNRPFSALVFFSLFIVTELNKPYLIWLPVIALISSLEAFLNRNPSSSLNKYSVYLYTVIGSLSLVYWILLFSPTLIPMALTN